jgi:AraC-like DNA-binding protein
MKFGTGRIVPLSGEEIAIKAGDIFYLPRGLKYHSYWSPDESGKVEWDSYGFSYLPLELPLHFAPQVIMADGEVRSLLHRVEKGAATPESVGRFYLFSARVIPNMIRAFTSPSDELLEAIRSYITEHLDFRVPELARHLGMSESSLYGFFRNCVGKTPVELKQEIQVERAAALLSETEISVENIAAACGFHTAAYFRKIFLLHTGVSPSRHRQASQRINYM